MVRGRCCWSEDDIITCWWWWWWCWSCFLSCETPDISMSRHYRESSVIKTVITRSVPHVLYFNIQDGNIDILQVSILWFQSKINLNSTKLRYWLNYSQINSLVTPPLPPHLSRQAEQMETSRLFKLEAVLSSINRQTLVWGRNSNKTIFNTFLSREIIKVWV